MTRSPSFQRTAAATHLAFGLSLAGLLGLGCTDSVDPHQDVSVGGSGVVGGSSNAGGATTTTKNTRATGGSSGSGGGATATTNSTHVNGGASSSVGGATATTNSTHVNGGASSSNVGGSTASAGKSSSAAGGSAGNATGGSAAAAAGAGAVAGASGGTSKGCYSPIQNTAYARQAGAVGCACDPETDVDICVQGVGLLCMSGSWRAVYDGPCMPRPKPTYSPTSCTQAGGTPVASPGTPITAEKDCTSGAALGIIDSASSGWDEGGLCCAPVKACGARAGDTCSITQYCAYQEGQYCGQADAQATCKPRPTTCVELNAPVCGCNGKTYGNSCLAAAAGIGVYSSGKCTN